MCRCKRCTGRCRRGDWIRPLTRHRQSSSRWHRYTTSSRCCVLAKAAGHSAWARRGLDSRSACPETSCLGHFQGGQRGWRTGLLAWGRSLHQPQSRKLSYCKRGWGPERLARVPVEHPWGRYHIAKNTWTSTWPISTCWRCCFDRNTSLSGRYIPGLTGVLLFWCCQACDYTGCCSKAQWRHYSISQGNMGK